MNVQLTMTPEPDAAAAGFCPERLQRLVARLRADVEREEIPGAVVLIVRKGITACFESVGYADRARGEPMGRDSIFRIASMTKPLTVAAALILMERGALVLSDPVVRYIPEFRALRVGVETPDPVTHARRLTLEPPRHVMTLHDLMRHTAGFTYGQFGDSLVQRAYRAAHLIDNQQSNQDLVTKLAQVPLAHQPGSTFEYGMSTDVLGRVIEIIAGQSLDRVLAETITEPLGMHSTSFGVAASELRRLAAPRHDATPGQKPAVVPYDPAHPAKWFSGGGGLLSTAADYASFCRMLLAGGEFGGSRLLSRQSVALMTHNHLPAGLRFGPHTAELGIAAPLPERGQGYGLGLGVRLEPGLVPVAGSVGDYFWGGALGPYFWVDPVEDMIVVFMLQELEVQRRTRYRSLIRSLVYQALV